MQAVVGGATVQHSPVQLHVLLRAMSALCFLLPLVERLSHLRASRPVALVLGPVRELCIQTETVAKQLMQGEGDVLD